MFGFLEEEPDGVHCAECGVPLPAGSQGVLCGVCMYQDPVDPGDEIFDLDWDEDDGIDIGNWP